MYLGVETLLKIFDAHMHIGKAYKSIKDGDWESYIVNAMETNINGCIMMPPCIPDFTSLPDGTRVIDFLCLRDETGVVRYVSKKELNGHIVIEDVKSDPFFQCNKDLLCFCEKVRSDKFLARFAPLAHPLFFDFDSFTQSEWDSIIALKIHPGSFGIEINDVPKKFWEKVEKIKKPVILHTGYKNSIGHEWLDVLKKYNIKVLFTHAMRLDTRTSQIINSDKRYSVGIAPYKRLSEMKNFQHTTDFLLNVSQLFSAESLIFDTDYPENFMPDTKEFHWDFIEDMQQYWNQIEIEDIMYKNAKAFFELENEN